MKTLRIEFEDSPGHILTIVSPVSLDAYFIVREAYEAGNWGEREGVRGGGGGRGGLGGARAVPPPLPRASSAPAPSE